MKKKWIIPVVLGLAMFLSACSAASGSKTADTSKENSAPTAADGDAYHKIDAEEAKKMMDKGDVTIVDVRTLDEYNEAHVPDAINIPNESIDSKQPKELPDKDAVLITYCRTGVRSKQASDKLVELGYQNIYDMGGIVDWPYETKSEKGGS